VGGTPSADKRFLVVQAAGLAMLPKVLATFAKLLSLKRFRQFSKSTKRKKAEVF
jgi:hypothetical protein